MTRLREAIEASQNDISLGWEDRLDRAEMRIRRAVEANIDDVRLSEESLSDPDGEWAAGFRAGWRIAREAVGR
ncbi:MAG: hypothetical protein M0Z95_04415 [Actinomycetota bacterium]|nr:hypothetical protein [Actinomycetota bacterium]